MWVCDFNTALMKLDNWLTRRVVDYSKSAADILCVNLIYAIRQSCEAQLELQSMRAFQRTLPESNWALISELQRSAVVYLQRQKLQAIMYWLTCHLSNNYGFAPTQLNTFENFARADICARMAQGTFRCTDGQGNPTDVLQSAMELAGIPAGSFPANLIFEVEDKKVTVSSRNRPEFVVIQMD